MTEISTASRGTSLLDQVEGAEKLFLAGRRSREADLESAVKFFLEFLRGFESFDFNQPCVTVFGSARFDRDHEYYRLAREMGGALADAGYAVMTGGGPGIMEAANRGARESGGVSVGLNIELPFEQAPNPHLTHQLHFHHFQTRKLMLTRYSRGFAVFPGGFGTTDELLELLVAFHNDRATRKPVVLIDGAFWGGLLNWFENELGARQLIDPPVADLVTVVENESAALRALLG